jgi:hypothetical protein
MKPQALVLALVLGVSGIAAVAPSAYAQRFDRYSGGRYYRGRDRDEIHRRERLRERLIRVGDRVRLADRENDISNRERDRLYDRLDRVRDFLRGDSYVTNIEFDRRMRDLDEIERDIRVSRRLDRREDRYERRYDRRDDRYDRRY